MTIIKDFPGHIAKDTKNPETSVEMAEEASDADGRGPEVSVDVEAEINTTDTGDMDLANFELTVENGSSSVRQIPQQASDAHGQIHLIEMPEEVSDADGRGPEVLVDVDAQINITTDTDAMTNTTDAGAMDPVNFELTVENGSSSFRQIPQQASDVHGQIHLIKMPEEVSDADGRGPEVLVDVEAQINITTDTDAMTNTTDAGAMDPVNFELTVENGSSSFRQIPQQASDVHGQIHLNELPEEASDADGRGTEVSLGVEAEINTTDSGAMDPANFKLTARVRQILQQASDAHGQIHSFREFLREGLRFRDINLSLVVAVLLLRLESEEFRFLSDSLNQSSAEKGTVDFGRAWIQWLNVMARTGMISLNFLAVMIVLWRWLPFLFTATIAHVGLGSPYLFELFNSLSGSRVILSDSIQLPAFLFVLAGSLAFTLLYVVLVFILVSMFWGIYLRRM